MILNSNVYFAGYGSYCAIGLVIIKKFLYNFFIKGGIHYADN